MEKQGPEPESGNIDIENLTIGPFTIFREGLRKIRYEKGVFVMTYKDGNPVSKEELAEPFRVVQNGNMVAIYDAQGNVIGERDIPIGGTDS